MWVVGTLTPPGSAQDLHMGVLMGCAAGTRARRHGRKQREKQRRKEREGERYQQCMCTLFVCEHAATIIAPFCRGSLNKQAGVRLRLTKRTLDLLCDAGVNKHEFTHSGVRHTSHDCGALHCLGVAQQLWFSLLLAIIIIIIIVLLLVTCHEPRFIGMMLA